MQNLACFRRKMFWLALGLLCTFISMSTIVQAATATLRYTSIGAIKDTGDAVYITYSPDRVQATDAAGNLSLYSFFANATTLHTPSQTSGSACNAPPLQLAGTRIVNVSTEAQLHGAVANAQTGDTIVLANGMYNLTSTLYLNSKNNVTIRGNYQG